MPNRNEYSDDIYELTLKFTDNNVKGIIDWVIEKDITEETLHKNEKSKSNANALKEVLSSSTFYFYSIRTANLDSLIKFYEECLKDKLDALSKKEVTEAIVNGQIDRLKLALSDYIEDKPRLPANFREEKAKEYTLNATLLLEKVIKYVKKEYNNRITETKKAIIDYIDPHKEALQELRHRKRQVEEALGKLAEDKAILGDDSESIRSSLLEQLVEMEKLEQIEIGKIEDIGTFIEEIKISKIRFDDVISLLEHKKEKLDKQNEYLSLVANLNAKIPELKNTFAELATEFRENLSSIKTSLFLLGLSFNHGLIESIERQRQTNMVFGTDVVKVNEVGLSGKKENGYIDYIYDLDFFR